MNIMYIVLQNDAMDVEYLQEYETVVPSTSFDSNQCNIVSRERKKVADNNNNKLSHNKENIIHSNEVDANKTSSQIDEALQDGGTTANANSSEYNIRIRKKKINKKALQNTLEVSNNLNNIYEQTYNLKKEYYETRLKYMKRSVEAKERIAETIAEGINNCNMS